MHVRWLVAIVLVAASLVDGFTSTVVAADSALFKAALTKMLNDGWTLGPDGIVAAQDNKELAEKAAPSDIRPHYALAVVQIRQRRYGEAATALNEVIDRDPHHWGAWQGKIWLQMVARKYEGALADVEKLATLWPKPTEPDERLDDTSRFLGRVMGFLWGPATGKVDESRLKDVEDRLLESLSTSQRQIFDQSRATVLGKFTDLQDRTDTTRNQAKVDEERQKELDRQRLAAEKSDVAREKGTVDQQAAAARAAAEARLTQLGAERAQLDAQFNRLFAQGAAVQADINVLSAREQALIAQANDTDSDSERRRLLAQAAAAGAARAQAQGAYAALDAQAAGVNAQRSANLEQQRQVTASYQNEMRRIGVKAESLERTEKRIASDVKKAVTPASGMTVGVRTLANNTAAFVTYFDFPVDLEKRRLLDSLDKVDTK